VTQQYIKRLTEPQTRALMWLTDRWTKTDRSISAAVHSLQLSYRMLVEERTGPYGPRGGFQIQFRLTELGVQEKALRRIP